MWFKRSCTFQVVGQVLLKYFAVTVPFAYLSYPLMKWRGFPQLRDLPNFHWVLIEMGVFTLIEEILFYHSQKVHGKGWMSPCGIFVNLQFADRWCNWQACSDCTQKSPLLSAHPSTLWTDEKLNGCQENSGWCNISVTLYICYYQVLTVSFLCPSVPGWVEHHGQWAEIFFIH